MNVLDQVVRACTPDFTLVKGALHTYASTYIDRTKYDQILVKSPEFAQAVLNAAALDRESNDLGNWGQHTRQVVYDYKV